MAVQHDKPPVDTPLPRPLRTVGVGAALALVLGASAGLEAAPEHVRLSYTGPSDSSMTIAWNTAGDVGTEVQYGTSPGNYTDTVTGTSFAASGALGFVHEVTLGGLAADTVYYYRAGEAGDGYSAEHSFTTGPAPDENCAQFRFVYLGDNRPDPIFGGGQNYDTVLAQAFAHGPAFLLNGGDLVEDGGNIGQWLDYLGYNNPEVASLPNLPCLGNHDTGPGEGDGAHFNQLFALPRSQGQYGSGTEDYFYFTYGNAIFVVLSTESFEGGGAPFANQAAWLDEVLTNNPRLWKFVYYHKPSYTHEVLFSISHEPNEEGQNAELIPIIDKHHVDVVLTSHNHWYERYEPSACSNQGNPGSNVPCTVADPSQGTVHIVSGGAGAFTIPGFLCGNPSGRVTCSGDHHYLVFDIDNETLTMETWGASPQPNQVIDSLTIAKPPANCSPLPPDGGTGGSGTGGSGTGGSGTGASGTGGSGTGASGTGGSGTGGAGALGLTPVEEGGCDCRTRPARMPDGLPAVGLLLALGLLRRRSRRSS